MKIAQAAKSLGTLHSIDMDDQEALLKEIRGASTNSKFNFFNGKVHTQAQRAEQSAVSHIATESQDSRILQHTTFN